MRKEAPLSLLVSIVQRPFFRKSLVLLIVFSLFSLWVLVFRTPFQQRGVAIGASRRSKIERKSAADSGDISRRSLAPPVLAQKGDKSKAFPTSNHLGQQPTESKILFFTSQKENTQAVSSVIVTLEINRFKYDTTDDLNSFLAFLKTGGSSRYSVIIFDELENFLSLLEKAKDAILNYCQKHGSGIIVFCQSSQDSLFLNSRVGDYPLYTHTNIRLKDLELNKKSPLLKITKARSWVRGKVNVNGWTVFQSNHSTYQPVALAKPVSSNNFPILGYKDSFYSTVILDRGSIDGVQKIFFGNSLAFNLHLLLFLDSLAYFSGGQMYHLLERYILIDIDDIFLGEKGNRMKPADVHELLTSQQRLQSKIPGFHYNLGFSSNFYHRGDDQENAGDDELLRNTDQFWWFPHMWKHSQPHQVNRTSQLEADMKKNRLFAQEHGIPLNNSYAVAPFHSGVYPVHEPLYQAWKKVWDVQVTSTEEYPHLKPAWARKAFVHNDIMVLPRQTCGLFTTTLHFNTYPGGKSKLDNSINGGELFQTVINNMVSLFMTHRENYLHDRMAIYTFERLVDFIQKWTNIQLKTLPPKDLAHLYFKFHPEDRLPVWQNPCADKRHLAIWPKHKPCDRFPDIIIIGPQNTEATVLYAFLKMHPLIYGSNLNPVTMEEVHFFNGANYLKGLDWYMESFSRFPNRSSHYLMEKSSSYFDNPLAPMRAHTLLPRAKIITVLNNPINHAYSWYQRFASGSQQKMTVSYTFHEIVTAPPTSPKGLLALQKKCLLPGMYAKHLKHWLQYYSKNQVLILDSELLETDPFNVLDKVQHFLNIPIHNYKDKIQIDENQGIFCQLPRSNQTQCLDGAGEGLQYGPMEERTREYLEHYYRSINVELYELLVDQGRQLPIWLRREMGQVN